MSNIGFKKNKKLDCSFAEFKNADLKLVSGLILKDFKLAFKTFGSLNQNKTNAILICHALTGDQYVSGQNPITDRDGWWSRMVGPDKPIDTNKFFVKSYDALFKKHSSCNLLINLLKSESLINTMLKLDIP